MNKLSFAALALVAAALPASFVFTGCGSESSTDVPSTDDGGAEGSDPRLTADCKLGGTACTTSADCCTGNCDPTTKLCGTSLGSCVAPGSKCTTNNQCCTFSCTDGSCSKKQCVADKGACTADGQCCGGKCTGGMCTPLMSILNNSGNP